ncbi:MlaA family lipoprotein [Gallibacterium trehalosifermentans]|uniref:MlaA family lipoprotein n=1 Tax=Gallibacterium trehalosifermentans TaxID=516935 RepID=A0ABV6H1F9_9PAST
MKKWFNKKSLVVIAVVSMTVGCASHNENGERNDPLQSFNRAMWNVNYNYLDPYVLRPVAKGWRDYVPAPVKTGLTNFANNLDEPMSFVNRLLEGNFKQAMVHFDRFWINSVFGLGGLIDIASASEPLRVHETREFGDMLGHYGMGAGSYVVLPGYGAATPRQDLGHIVDMNYPMLSLLGPWSLLKWGIQGIDKRASVLDQDALLKQAQDPYVTYREAYFQNLNFKVSDGKVENKSKETLDKNIVDEID